VIRLKRLRPKMEIQIEEVRTIIVIKEESTPLLISLTILTITV
jgi:hypothetical protein